MVAFSRLQLAAALLEYDNDPDDPQAPYRSAQESAIFSHMRRALKSDMLGSAEEGQSTDYLGLTAPSELTVPQDTRRSRTSQSIMLNNPFGGDDETDNGEEAGEVDLESWGLDSFIPKEKGNKAGKGKAKSDILPQTRQFSSAPVGQRPETQPHGRAMSVGDFGAGGAFLDADSLGGLRRNSISNPLDAAEEMEYPHDRQRHSTHVLIERMPVKSPLHTSHNLEEHRDSIPFPSSPDLGNDAPRSQSRLDTHARTHSSGTIGTLGSRLKTNDENNPFVVPPPPPERGSRFDPKYAASVNRPGSVLRSQEDYDNRMSMVDAGSVRDRRLSAASFGTRHMLDNDRHSTFSRDEFYDGGSRRFSRMDLMRPKVLIMPSPLQNQIGPENSALPNTREGFLDSSDGRPLPPGARASRPVSVLNPSSSVNIPSSNSFTPNPRMSLSASQLLFRNTLMVDGQRDVTYHDIDGHLPRAENDGEQIKMDDATIEERIATPAPVLPDLEKERRPAGKLFGRSLIDDLEARKAEMRSKQRVFTGDHRPSMMDRQLTRSSTLIDPASLQQKPSERQMELLDTQQSALNRRNSRGGKPLLSFDDETNLESRMPKARSVFGVDTLWQKEMIKLKDIEAQEKIEAEERRKMEEELESKRQTKKKRKGKSKSTSPLSDREFETGGVETPRSEEQERISPVKKRQSTLLPTLPDIPHVTSRRRTNMPDDDSDDESSASEAIPRVSMSSAIRDKVADDWVSDDENKKAREQAAAARRATVTSQTFARGDESDEDVPLSITLQRASQMFSAPRLGDDESDEDRPISALIKKTKSTRLSLNFDSLSSPSEVIVAAPRKLKPPASEESEEDNEPLGIRMSRLPTSSVFSGVNGFGGDGGNSNNIDEDEDDRPLGMHPEQLRRSQYMLAQVQQQQQQQQFFQAQMAANAMAFVPPPMMMMMPPAPPSLVAAPVQDTAKFGRVDRWRHDVAIEGQI